MLGALAGGGLTAAGLGGLAPGALGSNLSETTTPSEVTASGEPPAETTATAAPPASTTPAPVTTPTSTTTTPQPATPAPEQPAVVLQRRQKVTKGTKQSPSATATTKGANGKNNVEGSPQSVARAGALAAVLASSQASVQALSFYRVPLFLLPIYKAAAVQYGVPWQILAAINEIETDYGADQSVSSAGAVGWMQFMPETWMQYGVDALNAGYADPYNPVDAMFAAARYLRAAGAAKDLRRAILAYNHSDEYVDSVMLRAKLIATYPKPVIATLTGLVDGRPPVDGKVLEWGALPQEPASSNATANAQAAPAQPPPASGGQGATAASPTAAAAARIAHAAPQDADRRADERAQRQGRRRPGRQGRQARHELASSATTSSCATSTATSSPTPASAASRRLQGGQADPGQQRLGGRAVGEHPRSCPSKAGHRRQPGARHPAGQDARRRQNHASRGGKATIPTDETVPAG